MFIFPFSLFSHFTTESFILLLFHHHLCSASTDCSWVLVLSFSRIQFFIWFGIVCLRCFIRFLCGLFTFAYVVSNNFSTFSHSLTVSNTRRLLHRPPTTATKTCFKIKDRFQWLRNHIVISIEIKTILYNIDVAIFLQWKKKRQIIQTYQFPWTSPTESPYFFECLFAANRKKREIKTIKFNRQKVKQVNETNSFDQEGPKWCVSDCVHNKWLLCIIVCRNQSKKKKQQQKYQFKSTIYIWTAMMFSIEDWIEEKFIINFKNCPADKRIIIYWFLVLFFSRFFLSIFEFRFFGWHFETKYGCFHRNQ